MVVVYNQKIMDYNQKKARRDSLYLSWGLKNIPKEEFC